MTTAANSLGKPKNRMTYFRMSLKQNWQQLVLYCIIMLFSCVVPAIFQIIDNLERLARLEGSFYPPSWYGDETLHIVGILFSVFSCIIGVFAGMLANGYVNSKRSIHCFHSLPLTREALFVEEGLVQGMYYLMAAVCAAVISLVSILINLGCTGEGLYKFFLMFLTGIAGYLVVFTLFQMAAGLTGTGIFRLITAGLIAFLPILLYLLAIVGVEVGMYNLESERYITEPIARFLCPAVNIYFTMYHSFSLEGLYFLDVLSLFGTAAVYYGLALFLHRRRKSELSGISVIWKKIHTIVKYPVIFTCGAGGGILFQYLFGAGTSWLFFGMVCGLMVSFMLMNVLITRSAKSMFKGLPGLGITTVVVLVYMAVFPFDIFHLNTFLYETEDIRSLRIMRSQMDITMTDPDDIAAVMPYMEALTQSPDHYDEPAPAYYAEPGKEVAESMGDGAAILKKYYKDAYAVADSDLYVWQNSQKSEFVETISQFMEEYGEVMDYYYEDVYYRAINGGSSSFRTDIVPGFGIPLYRRVQIMDNSRHSGFWDALAETNAYEEYFTVLASVNPTEIAYMSIQLLDQSITMLNHNMMDPLYLEALEKLLIAASHYDPSMRNTTVIGTLHINMDGPGYAQMPNGQYGIPLYAGMTEFWEAFRTFWMEQVPSMISDRVISMEDMGTSFENFWLYLQRGYELYENTDVIFPWMAEQYEQMLILEADTGRFMAVSPENEAEVLAKSYLGYSYGETVLENGYLVVAMKINMDNLLTGKEIYYNYDTCFWFREGEVPPFVVAAFEP